MERDRYYGVPAPFPGYEKVKIIIFNNVIQFFNFI